MLIRVAGSAPGRGFFPLESPCACQRFIAVTKMPDENKLEETGLFCLTVSEVQSLVGWLQGRNSKAEGRGRGKLRESEEGDRDRYSPQDPLNPQWLTPSSHTHLPTLTAYKSVQIITPSNGLIHAWGYSPHDQLFFSFFSESPTSEACHIGNSALNTWALWGIFWIWTIIHSQYAVTRGRSGERPGVC